MLSPKDIAELEKKYSKYKLKKRLKASVFIVLFLLIVSYIIFYIFNSSLYKQENTDINKTVNNRIKKTDNKIQLANIKNVKKSSEKLSAKTTKDINISDKNSSNVKIEKNINDNNKSNILKNKIVKKLVFHIYPSEKLASNNYKSVKLKLNLNFFKNKNTMEKSVNISKSINKNDTIRKETNVKTKIDIKIKDIDSIAYLKNKFQRTHDIDFALMLCENYYSKKMYRKSLKWSIIANDIDNQGERSWIWFAKSKYRLNERNDAIKALRAYLKSNDSKKIRLLLKDIINGELYD